MKRKLFKQNKRGIWPLLAPILGLWWMWVIAGVVIIAILISFWIALPKLIAIAVAVFGAWLVFQSGGNSWPGWTAVIIGLLIFYNPGGMLPLSWYSISGNIVDIDVNNQNELTYDIANIQPLKGALGVIAVFADDDFKRADYFYTSTNGNRPESSMYRNRFTETIKLSDYLPSGQHNVKVCYELTTHQADYSRYDLTKYYNMKKCGYEWENLASYTQPEMEQETKDFNFKWLPCSKTKTSQYNPIVPENVLGSGKSQLGVQMTKRHFYYEQLAPDEIMMFKNLEDCLEFDVTIGGSAWVDDGNNGDDTPSDGDNTIPEQKESVFAKLWAWLSGIFTNVRVV